MANKNRKALAAAKQQIIDQGGAQTPEQQEVVETQAQVTETPAADAPVTESAPEPTTTPAPATTTARVYWKNEDREFKPRRGFETVLYNALSEPRSATELAQLLLQSGEYTRVAPKAAANRTLKPIKFLLKTWLSSHVVKASAQ